MGSGSSSSVRTTLKMAAVPPAPRARVSTARTVYVGRLARRRAEYPRSMIQLSSIGPPECMRLARGSNPVHPRHQLRRSSAGTEPSICRQSHHRAAPGPCRAARSACSSARSPSTSSRSAIGRSERTQAHSRTAKRSRSPTARRRTTRLQVVEHSRVILQCRNNFDNVVPQVRSRTLAAPAAYAGRGCGVYVGPTQRGPSDVQARRSIQSCRTFIARSHA